MRTIFIPIFQGVEARNLLRNDFFKILRSTPDLRIVILVLSAEKKAYLEREFSGVNVVFELANVRDLTGWRAAVVDFLRYNLLRTRRMSIRRRVNLEQTRNYLAYTGKSLFTFLFARRPWRRLVRYCTPALLGASGVVSLFEQYQPDLLLAAHLFGNRELQLLNEAKKRGVRSVGVINSWDKLTSRGIILLLPDKLLVHNELIRQEAIEHADMAAASIEIVGAPHYDLLFTGQPRARAVLETELGLSPGQPILLVCPAGQYYSDSDATLINLLVRLQRSGKIRGTQILVRFPPNDTVDLRTVEAGPDLHYYQPGVRFSTKRGVDWDMDDRDNQLLLDSLYWSGVVICPPSSISIDAAIVDRPVLNFIVASDKRWTNNNINLFYHSDHYSKLLQTGGVRVVQHEEELAEWINTYLADPALDRQVRQAIVQQQCQFTDGRSGERMARAVLRYLLR